MNYRYDEIGKRIRLRRKELQIKQSSFAEILDISNNHLSSIENGREKPSLDLLLLICEHLNVTPDYLLLGNMHTNDISLNILDSLRLCDEADLITIRQIIELFVERNQSNWNETHTI